MAIAPAVSTRTVKGLSAAGGAMAHRAPVSSRQAQAAQRDWQRGATLARQGDLLQAARLFERATQAAPGVSLYWLNLANVQRKLKREAQALDSAKRAFALDRGSLVACHLLVELLRHHNRRTEALATLRQLDAATDRNVDHHWLEGDLLFSMNRAEEATQPLLQVLVMQPGHADAYMKLGFSLAWLKQYGSAAECFRTVAMMDPRQLGAAVYAVHYAAWACDWTQARDDLVRMDRAQALLADEPAAPPTSPFCLVAIRDDAAVQRRVARREAARLVRELQRRVDWPAALDAPDRHAAARALLAQGRCRIGFVACDFRDHATSILMARLVELLDRSRFEVWLYSHGEPDDSALQQRLAAAADRFVDCRHLSPLEQAERIRADGVTLLIDLMGFTLNSRLQMFALRPAPVQASWLAFPGTTGANFIDYLIGDPVVTPLAHADDFEECIAQLPLSYQANDELRDHPDTVPGRSEVGLPEHGIVFACFNQSYKFSDEVFGAWCRILQQVPGSVLWLLVPQHEVQARLRAEALARGVAADRLVFAPFVSQRAHLARLPLADIALDTFPCGAHTTCSDALWMGVPLVTRMGRSFASRVAGSLLAAVGLEALAVHSLADFEALAVRLAGDLPLFDSARFARDFGALADRMVARWQQGLPPAALPAA
jgi:protein O-GlcNAc transferase